MSTWCHRPSVSEGGFEGSAAIRWDGAGEGCTRRRLSSFPHLDNCKSACLWQAGHRVEPQLQGAGLRHTRCFPSSSASGVL